MNFSGIVTASLDPVIEIEVSNGIGLRERIEAVVDSGFNDFVSLPKSVAEDLSLISTDPILVELADGNVVETPTFIGRVLWDGAEQIIRVQQGEGRPLVGMVLLLEHRITIDVHYNGAVRIAPIPDTQGIN